MNCPLFDTLCEYDYFLNGLSEIDQNAIWQSLIGVALGALLAFGLGWLQWLAQRRAEDRRAAQSRRMDDQRLAESRRVEDERADRVRRFDEQREMAQVSRERHLRNMEAAILVARFSTTKRFEEWENEARVNHHLESHLTEPVPEDLADDLPLGASFATQLALTEPMLISTGPIHELLQILHNYVTSEDARERPDKMITALGLFNRATHAYFHDDAKNATAAGFRAKLPNIDVGPIHCALCAEAT